MGERLPIIKGTICSGFGDGDPRGDYASKGKEIIERLKEENNYKNNGEII